MAACRRLQPPGLLKRKRDTGWHRQLFAHTFQMGGSSRASPMMLTPLMWWCTLLSAALGVPPCFCPGTPLPSLDSDWPREGGWRSSKLAAAEQHRHEPVSFDSDRQQSMRPHTDAGGRRAARQVHACDASAALSNDLAYGLRKRGWVSHLLQTLNGMHLSSHANPCSIIDLQAELLALLTSTHMRHILDTGDTKHHAAAQGLPRAAQPHTAGGVKL